TREATAATAACARSARAGVDDARIATGRFGIVSRNRTVIVFDAATTRRHHRGQNVGYWRATHELWTRKIPPQSHPAQTRCHFSMAPHHSLFERHDRR